VLFYDSSVGKGAFAQVLRCAPPSAPKVHLQILCPPSFPPRPHSLHHLPILSPPSFTPSSLLPPHLRSLHRPHSVLHPHSLPRPHSFLTLTPSPSSLLPHPCCLPALGTSIATSIMLTPSPCSKLPPHRPALSPPCTPHMVVASAPHRPASLPPIFAPTLLPPRTLELASLLFCEACFYSVSLAQAAQGKSFGIRTLRKA
jgi:hypothetical protein